MLIVRQATRAIARIPLQQRTTFATAAAALLATRANAPPPPPPLPRRARIQHRQNGKDYTDSYMLADRVKLLAQRDQLEAAIDLVKSSASHTANIVVWNVLLNAILRAGKFKLAYTTWMDLKRRGRSPTARSFGTFLSGFAAMRGEMEGAGLARVKTVFAQWLLHAERVIAQAEKQDRGVGGAAGGGGGGRRSILQEEQEQEQVDQLDDITNLPTNHYLTFLSHTHNIPLLLETFDAMPAEGPLAPSSMTYSIVLAALRTTSATNPEHFQVALKLWQRMLDEMAEIDTKTVSIVISICREAKRPDDQRVGLQVAKDFYGFVDPAEEDSLVDPKKLAPPRVPMDSPALSNVFALALAMQQFNLVVRWFDQVRDYPKRFGAGLVDHHQCELVLVALAAKHDAAAAEDLIHWMRTSSNPSLQPTLASYTNAIQVCWRSADLPRAYRLLSLMTARPIGPSPSPSDPAAATPEKEGKTCASTFLPDDRILSTLLQTSLATRDRGHISRALDVVEGEFGRGRGYYASRSTVASKEEVEDEDVGEEDGRIAYRAQRGERRQGKADPHAAYWKFKLGEVLERCLERVLQGGEGHLSVVRRGELVEWRARVVRWLEERDRIGPSGVGGKEEESMKGRRELLREREEVRERRHEGKRVEGERERAREKKVEKEKDPWRSDAPSGAAGSGIRRGATVKSPYAEEQGYRRMRPAFSHSRPDVGREFEDRPPPPPPRRRFDEERPPRRASFDSRSSSAAGGPSFGGERNDDRPRERRYDAEDRPARRSSFTEERPRRSLSFEGSSRDERPRERRYDSGDRPPSRRPSFSEGSRDERPRRSSYSSGGGGGPRQQSWE